MELLTRLVPAVLWWQLAFSQEQYEGEKQGTIQI